MESNSTYSDRDIGRRCQRLYGEERGARARADKRDSEVDSISRTRFFLRGGCKISYLRDKKEIYICVCGSAIIADRGWFIKLLYITPSLNYYMYVYTKHFLK